MAKLTRAKSGTLSRFMENLELLTTQHGIYLEGQLKAQFDGGTSVTLEFETYREPDQRGDGPLKTEVSVELG